MIRAFLKYAWRGLGVLGTIVGIIYLPADMFGLVDAYPSLAGAEMPDRFTLIASAALVMAVYIFWMDIRPLVRPGIWRKKRQPALLAMADEAEDLSDAINELVGESISQPPTLPKYIKDTDLWQDENNERKRRSLLKYHAKYATKVLQIIDTAKRLDIVDKNEIWSVSNLDTGYGLENVPKFLASVASRLRDQAKGITSATPNTQSRQGTEGKTQP